MSQEIERKFLISSPLPELSNAPKAKLKQGYLSTGESEVRLRDENGVLSLTCKQGNGLVRAEREINLSQEQFDALWPMTEGQRIEKTRYRIPLANLIIELDLFEGALKPLVVAEVEFDSIEESQNFKLPSFFGQEITEDKRYKNRNLATQGLPQVTA